MSLLKEEKETFSIKKKKIEKEKTSCERKLDIILLLQLCRYYREDSPFHKDNLPLDIYLIIVELSDLRHCCKTDITKVDVSVFKSNNESYFCKECFLDDSYDRTNLDKSIVKFFSYSNFVGLFLKLFSYLTKTENDCMLVPSIMPAPSIIFFPCIKLCCEGIAVHLYTMSKFGRMDLMRIANEQKIKCVEDFCYVFWNLLDYSALHIGDKTSHGYVGNELCKIASDVQKVYKYNGVICYICEKLTKIPAVIYANNRSLTYYLCDNCAMHRVGTSWDININKGTLTFSRDERWRNKRDEDFDHIPSTKIFMNIMRLLWNGIVQKVMDVDELPYKIFFVGENFSLNKVYKLLNSVDLNEMEKSLKEGFFDLMINNRDCFMKEPCSVETIRGF